MSPEKCDYVIHDSGLPVLSEPPPRAPIRGYIRLRVEKVRKAAASVHQSLERETSNL